MKLSDHALSLCLVWDVYSSSFLFTVRIISSSVFLFSLSYIREEPNFTRFHLLILRFVISMYILISRPNLVRLLLGWDGLGLTSYLLVVYFQRVKAYNAGILTALRNRVGDVFILIAIGLFSWVGAWNFFVLSQGSLFQGRPLIALLVVLAACTKRAQIPFSAWLPAAMAAPTPVSSLVHSSTLVTAGIYLAFRFQPMLSSRGARRLLLILGVRTITLAGLAATSEIDIKKIVALSTLSQLGVIATCMGAGIFRLAFLHLLSHAYFKALLFIRVGARIHISRDYQDLRKAGSDRQLCPSTIRFRVIARLSLCGAPFRRGFYSKDLCIEVFIFSENSGLLTCLFYFATLLTAAYRVRFTIIRFQLTSRVAHPSWAFDFRPAILGAIGLLLPLAIAGGGLISWALFFGPVPISISKPEKSFVTLVVILGALWGALTSKITILTRISFIKPLYLIWGLPVVSSRTPSLPFFRLGGHSRSRVDQFWLPLALFLPTKLNEPFSIWTRRTRKAVGLARGGLILWTIIFGLLYLCVIGCPILCEVKVQVTHIQKKHQQWA